jgi:hypothetical protein
MNIFTIAVCNRSDNKQVYSYNNEAILGEAINKLK